MWSKLTGNTQCDNDDDVKFTLYRFIVTYGVWKGFFYFDVYSNDMDMRKKPDREKES